MKNRHLRIGGMIALALSAAAVLRGPSALAQQAQRVSAQEAYAIARDAVTAYDAQGYFIPNALNRQALGDRDKLAFNSDGSLDLYLQADSPGKAEKRNWLPVAKTPFNLLMRLYWPKSQLFDGTWSPPPVKRVS
jgi:hypothetical protein